jgi:CheY-like chemotaxis protein
MSRSPSAPVTARIVLVDDDEYVREVTEMVLTGAGHSVRSTASGLEALRFLEEESCDLLIADLRMPEIDGPTLHREIVARWPHDGPRVLFVSGQTDAPGESTVAPLDVPVLVKPFTLDDLHAAVARLLTAP